MKKYEITNNSIQFRRKTFQFRRKTLYQIRALKDFDDVKAGDLGGYIEKESNLSQDGNCWVYNYAKVYDDAKVFENAKVYGCTVVYDNAEVYGAKVYGAEVYGNAEVCGNAVVCGDVEIYGDSVVSSDDVNKIKINQEEKQEPPKHYDLTIQPIDYIVANKLNFAEGNVIKYVSRYKLKNGKEDLLKAKYYLDLLIKEFDN